MSAPRDDEGSVLYVRRGDKVTGPFARPLVLQRLALGRIRPDDELSPDALTWRRAEEFLNEGDSAGPQMPSGEPPVVNWRKERQAAWLRWIDERGGQDRRTAAWPAHFSPRGPDRRDPSGAGRRALFRPAGVSRRSAWLVPLAAVVAVVAVLVIMRWWLPETRVAVPVLTSPEARHSR